MRLQHESGQLGAAGAPYINTRRKRRKGGRRRIGLGWAREGRDPLKSHFVTSLLLSHTFSLFRRSHFAPNAFSESLSLPLYLLCQSMMSENLRKLQQE